MLFRFGLIVLLIHYTSSATREDEDASKWVVETVFNEVTKNADGDKPLDLTPTNVDEGKPFDLNLTNVVGEDKPVDLTPSNVDATVDCEMDDGTSGKCVQYYQCANRTIVSDGSTIIDIRENRRCPTYLEVCCGLGEKTTSGNPLIINGKPYETPILNDGQCGWNKAEISIFAATDKEQIYADYGEFPWMVAIIKKGESNVWSPNDYLGGGSIIHPSVVITVAHKVDQLNAKEIKCRGGEWDTQTTKEQYPFQERDVNKILLHPQFFKTSLYYDVALLILEKPFNLGNAPHMGIACLNTVLPPPGTECFTMGWGKDLFNNADEYAVLLKKTKLPLVKSDDCQKQLQDTRLGPYFRLHSSLTCAGGKKGIDACQGDGGSSLVCPIENNGRRIRYAVAGIVAYGIGCGRANVPGVYVNVPEIYPWVNEVMADENFGKDTYTIEL